MKPIDIDIANPGFYYAATYVSSFLVAFILLTLEGIRRKFPQPAWWLVIATSFFFFMVGSQLIKFGPAEWHEVLKMERLSVWPGRSVLGGILLFVPGLLLAKCILRFNYRAVDTFAFLFPVGLAIQRIGCLLAGCCFGTPTTLPWAVKYNSFSPAFYHQVNAHLVPSPSSSPLPVHPTQVYDLLGCVLIFFILRRIKPRIKAPGNLLGASLFLYGCFRFFLEFVRAQNLVGRYDLNSVQITLLFLLPLAAFFLYRREKIFQAESEAPNSRLSPKVYGAYFLVLTLLFLLVSRWLSPFEIFSLNLVLLPTFGIIAWQAFKLATLPSMRLATLSLMAISMLLMSQTYPEYSRKDSTSLSYFSLSYGTMAGTSSAGFQPVFKQGSCGSGSSYTYTNRYNTDYSSKALGFSYTQQRGLNKSLIMGVNALWGYHNEDYAITTKKAGTNRFSTNAINPYMQYNWKNIGLGVGFYAGSFTQVINVNAYDSTSINRLSFSPSFSIRLGNLKEVFVEYRFANQFPSSFPSLTHQLGLGIGIGKRGGVLRLGTASNASFYLGSSFTLGKNLILDPYVGLGPGLFANGEANKNVAAISLHYKFARIEKSKKSK